MLDPKITKLIEKSVKARLDLREALVSFSATLDQARERIQREDEEARSTGSQPWSKPSNSRKEY